ncbi:hypothetical protein FJ930_19740 [Mesorhizobium sp. B2-4-15]|uniref:hypothetical protein n=1 Tax=Mesorhizobium sp. B2-4-15 TaxID=2589934 RepID=UPI001154E033|nr:hypothetical protein [Mesorhizobium sp. B2-4-15]TPK70202.1 hypothetical protein FJ930_19740 [Mesorhizobium sp. B2-4-15]
MNVHANPNANYHTVNVSFRSHAQLDEQASKKAGRQIWTEIEVCDISFPANRQTKATFPAHEVEPNATRESMVNGGPEVTYAQLYNDQYLAFKNGSAQPVSGTPLSEAPFLSEAKRRELKALNIHTVDALASLDGAQLKQLGMGGRELKNQAQAYLDNAAGSADVTGLAAQVALLQQQLAEERRLREEDAKAALNKRERIKAGEKIDEPADEDADDLETEEPEAIDPPTAEEIDAMDDEALKGYIARETGSRPRGNPNHDTLVAAAKELAMVA